MSEAVPRSSASSIDAGVTKGGSTERGLIALGGLGALLAGTCCLAPLALVSLGVSGAWLGNFRLLEPYRPVFLGVATVSLVLAWRRIYRPAARCEPGAICATPSVRRGYRIGFWSVVALLALMFAYPYLMPMFY